VKNSAAVQRLTNGFGW